MKRILIFTFALVVANCSDNHNDCCMNIEANLDLALKDVEGDNLLNTAEYPFNPIQVKYIHNGLLQNYQSPLLLDEQELPKIRIFLNLEENNEYPITYVKWNNTDTDTIKAHFNRMSNSIIVDKIWINDELITNYEEPGHFFTLVK